MFLYVSVERYMFSAEHQSLPADSHGAEAHSGVVVTREPDTSATRRCEIDIQVGDVERLTRMNVHSYPSNFSESRSGTE